jgi:hypothetical protein
MRPTADPRLARLVSCLQRLPSSPDLTGRSNNHGTAIWAQHSSPMAQGLLDAPLSRGMTIRLDEPSESQH